MNQTNTLPAKSKITAFRDMVEARKGAIASILPKHLTPERITKVAVMAASRNPLLLEATPETVIRSIMTASQLGLEPDGPLGSAYLVPFKNNKTGRTECQLIVGYRGLIDLARRSGNIVSIEAHVVHHGDRFRCHFGLDPALEHEPAWDADEPGPMVAVYAIAKLRDGGVQAEVMTRAEVDAIRKRSRAGQSGPWFTDYEEMARKTVVKRLAKYLPMSVEMATAIEADNAADTGEVIDMPEMVDDSLTSAGTAGAIEQGTPAEIIEPANGNGNGTKAAALASKIKNGNGNGAHKTMKFLTCLQCGKNCTSVDESTGICAECRGEAVA